MKLLHEKFKLLDKWGMVAFLLPFAVYLNTLAPSVTFYDSGEFITAVYGLGSAHSPGYPLFLLFAKFFSWLPFGSFAFRVNLATAVSAALAVFGVYLVASQLILRFEEIKSDSYYSFIGRACALSGALVYAFSPRLWLQTNHDKPYPLLAFIVAVVFWLLLQWKSSLSDEERAPGWLYAAGFLIGAATGAHQIIVLFIPAVIVFILLGNPNLVKHIRDILLTLAFMIAGGAVQLYLPFRAAAHSLQNWGDSSALSRFLWHVLRKGYPEEPHSRTFKLLIQQLSAFNPVNEFGWVGLFFLLVGLVMAWRWTRNYLIAALVALACFWMVIAGYFNPEVDLIFLTEEFYTPMYMVSAVFVAIGFFAVVSYGVSVAERPEKFAPVHFLLVLAFCLLVPFGQAFANYSSQNQKNNYLAHEYAVNTLRVLPEGAVLFTWGDSGAFPLWYLQHVEKLRNDLDLPHIPHLVFAWYRKEMSRLFPFEKIVPGSVVAEAEYVKILSEILGSRPVYVDFSTKQSVRLADVWFDQEGILYRVSPTQVGIDSTAASMVWDYYSLQSAKSNYTAPPDVDSQKAVMIHVSALLEQAETLVKEGNKQAAEQMLLKMEKISPVLVKSNDMFRFKYQMPIRRTDGK